MAKPQAKKQTKNLNPYAKSKGQKITKNKNRKINQDVN
jgi:hypothetical protein